MHLFQRFATIRRLKFPTGRRSGSMNTTDYAIDAVGLECPEPLMILRNKVRDMAEGETVAVVATDPSTVRDFTNFCRFMGHELAESARVGDRYRFVIRKRGKGLRVGSRR